MPGVVASIQTYGDQGANWNPHAHLIVTDGVFSSDGRFTPIPPPDPQQMMLLFRHKLLKRLLALEKITERTVEILDSFRHPGFSVYQGWPIAPQDRQAREKLAAYVLHAPISLDRMNYDEAQGTVNYKPKPPTPDSPPAPAGGPIADGGSARFDPLDWLAAVTSHIPNKGQQLVRYSGWYSNKSRGCRKKAELEKAALAAAALDGGTPGASSPPVELPGGAVAAAVNEGADDDTPFRKQCLRAWARLIQRVYEIDPLRCPKCKSPMRFVAFIEEDSVIRKILNHLGLWDAQKRAPPAAGPALCGSEKVVGQPGLPLLPYVAEPTVIYDEPCVSYDEPA